MKLKITFTFALVLSLTFINAQDFNLTPNGGEFIFNPSKSPCLTSEERESIIKELKTNVKNLKLQNKLKFSSSAKRGSHILFTWPLQKAAGVNYNEIYGISGYVDHNTSYPNQLTDFNCGPKTYDTNSGYNHQGTDYFTWPFGWKMMDNDEVEIVAAASGQIIGKGDGQYDRSCSFNGNTWNAVYVQHSDGSIAWYGHMKNGSTTSKNVGDTVSEGEYLGIVGSSGNSTGPHLHFEVYEDNTYTQLIDPYTGSCNSMNPDSWWQSQKPYINPGINAVLTHNAPPVFPTCPTAETTNESNQFSIGDIVYTALFLKDQIPSTTVNLRVIKPDNTDLNNWDFNLTANYNASWWYWSFYPNIEGEWKWEATYEGETVTHTFNVGTLSDNSYDLEDMSIFPNPTSNFLNISSKVKIVDAHLVDALGKSVIKINNSPQGIEKLDLSELSQGIYFLTVESENLKRKTVKIIKK